MRLQIALFRNGKVQFLGTTRDLLSKSGRCVTMGIISFKGGFLRCIAEEIPWLSQGQGTLNANIAKKAKDANFFWFCGIRPFRKFALKLRRTIPDSSSDFEKTIEEMPSVYQCRSTSENGGQVTV